MKKSWRIVGNLFIAAILCTLLGRSYLLAESSPSPELPRSPAGQAAPVTLRVLPAEQTVYLGESFTVAVMVEAGSQPVDAAAAYLDFDPAVLQVVSLSPGSTLSTQIVNRYDNAAGQVDYAAGLLGGSATGTFPLLEVTFTAAAQSPATALQLNRSWPRESDVTWAGNSLLEQTAPASVTVQTQPPTSTPTSTATATGTATPPTPTSPTPSPTPMSPELPVSLAIQPAQQTVTLGETFSVVVAVQTGSQPVDAAAAYLDFDPAILQVTTVTPGTALDTQIVNRYDNVAGSIDFAAGLLGTTTSGTFDLVQITFRASGLSTGAPLHLSLAPPRQSDITGSGDSLLDQALDGVVTVLAPTPTYTSTPSPTATATHTPPPTQTPTPTAPAQPVTLGLFPAQQTVEVGQPFTVAVVLDAGSQQIDAAAAYLDYDPVVLQILTTTPGTVLDTQIVNGFDNDAGQVDYVAGLLGATATGRFDLIQITFVSTGSAEGTPLRFSLASPRQSDVAGAGSSLLDQASDASVTILAPTPTSTPIPSPTLAPTNTSTTTPTAVPTNTPTPMPTLTSTSSPTPTPTITPVPTSTATPMPMPTATQPPTDLHIGDLDATGYSERNWWTATITALVHDGAERPVAGATVEGSWSLGVPQSGSCVTDGNGLCTVTSDTLHKNVDRVTFAVTAVQHSTLRYDPAINHDPDGDSDGTQIVMYKTQAKNALEATSLSGSIYLPMIQR